MLRKTRLLALRASLLALFAASGGIASACFTPEYVDQEPGNASGSTLSFAVDASQFPPCQDVTPVPASSVAWTVTTHAFGGRFAPRNVGAIWIEDETGVYVDTLEQWGTTRKKWLKGYLAATEEQYVDAQSGATLLRHETHAGTWDLRSSTGCELAAGAYVLALELTDRSGTGALERLPIELTAAGTLELTNLPQFSSIVLQVESP